MKVVITGRPYRLADAVEVDAVEVEVVEEGAGPGVGAKGAGPGVGAEGMPSSFPFTRKAGLPNHRIGPSSLHLCDGGTGRAIPNTIAFRMQN